MKFSIIKGANLPVNIPVAGKVDGVVIPPALPPLAMAERLHFRMWGLMRTQRDIRVPTIPKTDMAVRMTPSTMYKKFSFIIMSTSCKNEL